MRREAEESTPKYPTTWRLGGGTAVARRVNRAEGLHLYRSGTVAERFLQEQAYVPVGGDLQSLVGHGRTKNIFDQRLAATGVVGPGNGRRVKAESGVVDAQWRLDDGLGMAAVTPKRDQRGLAASGPGRRLAVDRR
jgi:hypothetical protein